MSPDSRRHGYVAVGDRLVHYVTRGHGPVVVFLHASPGDCRTLTRLVDALGDDLCALALDTPGHGLSDPLDVPEPTIDDYGTSLLDTLSALRLNRVHLYGTHTGAKIALSAAVQAPHRVASLTLDGVGISTPQERADQLLRYTPTWSPRTDGSHLVRAWHQARNMFLFWPWYAEQSSHVVLHAMPALEDLHTIAHGLLLAGERYSIAYRAAFSFDPMPALAHMITPTTVVAAPADPLRHHLARLEPLPPTVRIDASAGDLAELVVGLRAQAATNASAQHVVAHELTAAQGGRRKFAATGIGDVHVSTGSEAPTATVVVAPVGARMDALRGDRTLVVELPGTGRSNLADTAEPSLDTLVTCLVEACNATGVRPQSVRSSGSSAAVAREFATRLRIPIEHCGLGGRVTTSDLPDLRPRADGAHLLAAWHQVRDAAIAYLHTNGRWPGTRGDAPDLELIQARAVSLVGSWKTLASVYAACHGDPAPTTVERPGMWDPLARSLRPATECP